MRALIGVVVALVLPAAAASGVTMEVRTGAGYNSNPAGIAGAAPQALGWTQGTLGWRGDAGDGTLIVGYAGNAYSYLPERAWSGHEHTGTASWSTGSMSTFLFRPQIAIDGSWNAADYRAYNSRGITASLATGTTLGDWPVEGKAEYELRSFPESTDFDFDEYSLGLSTRRTYDTRTTVTARVRYTNRTYAVRTTDDILSGRASAGSRLVQVDGSLGQGLSAQTGIRVEGWARAGDGESRWRSDYLQVLDDPLATSGVGGRAQVSWLAPLGLTARPYLAGHLLDESYVAFDGYNARRSDKQIGGGLVIEGYLPWTAANRAFTWSIDAGMRRQWSNDPDYTYAQRSIMAGVGYAW